MTLESWRWRDPADVYEREETRRLKARLAMTNEESARIEDLLMTWYEYERRYRPALGAPRVSVSCRGYQPDSGDVHESGSDWDERLNRVTAETVSFCLDKLAVPHRAAIGVHCRNKAAGASVWRSPRVIGEQHEVYQAAKEALHPHFKRAGLMEGVGHTIDA